MGPSMSKRRSAGDKDMERYVESRIKKRLDEILQRAKEKSDEMEEEWREPVTSDVTEISYYVDGEEQEEIEPVPLEKKKKPRSYMSFAEFVLKEIEKERKR